MKPVKIDTSVKAVTARLRRVAQLRRLALALRAAKPLAARDRAAN